MAIHLKDRQFVWVDLTGPEDEELNKFAELIGLHPLTLEEPTRSTSARSSRSTRATCSWSRSAWTREASGDPLLREVHLMISGDYVVTIHNGDIEPSTSCRKATTARRC